MLFFSLKRTMADVGGCQSGWVFCGGTAGSAVSVELAPNYILFLATRRQSLGFHVCVSGGCMEYRVIPISETPTRKSF